MSDEPLSPFLPGTTIQFAWDSTSLGYLKQCPRLYQYVMIEGWVPKDESIHLRFGNEFHKALEVYDKSKVAGLSHREALIDTVHETLLRVEDWDVDTETKAGSLKNRDTLIRTIVWYLDQYCDDPAKTWKLSNGDPAVEQSFRFEIEDGLETADGFQPYLLCGHLDRVVEFNGEVFGMDRKTTTTTPGPYFFNSFEPNNQMSLYTLALKVVFNAPVKGIIIDAAQIAVGFSRFVRGFTYRTSDQLEEWLRDLRLWLRKAEEYAVAGYWPQNDTACDKFGGCRFREICSKAPGVRSNFLAGDFKKQKEEDRWNPLKTR